MTNLVYGLHAVQALLGVSPEKITLLYALEGRSDIRLQNILQLAEDAKCPVKFLSRTALDNLAKSTHHQGVVAECSHSLEFVEEDLPSLLAAIQGPKLILVLDGVQDPHNLGACLRSANALGVHLVIAPKDNSVGITPVVRKVASGAAEVTPFIQVTNLARCLRTLQDQGLWITGTAADGETNLYQADLKGDLVIVMGGEGQGMRRLTKEHCDFLVNIPMQGTVSSLNVSVATAIMLYEAQRQRRQSKP